MNHMTKWTRLQDKIASSRLLIGFILLTFSCVFFVFFAIVQTNLIVYYTYLTKGIVTDFRTLQEGGIASHHMQYINLTGLIRYDMPLDIVDYQNHLKFRVLVIQDEDTQYAVLINNHKFSGLGPAERDTVYGFIRKMDDETFAYFLDEFGEDISQLQTAGWTIEPRYYINDLEKIPDPKVMKYTFLFGAVNIFLILIFLALLLTPHPKIPKKKDKENDPFGSIVRQQDLF